MAKKETQANESPVQPSSARGEKKGHPTPSRRDAEAARQRPLVPSDRKLAKQNEKQKRNESYQREQLALQTGDERYLPWRDRGKVRRFVRDWIDARWSISEFLLPGMLLFLVGMLAMGFLFPEQSAGGVVVVAFTAILYGLFAVSVVEGLIVWFRLRSRITRRYPDEEIAKGTWFYMFSRMLMARRWRSPKPQVSRGEFPKVPDQTR